MIFVRFNTKKEEFNLSDCSHKTMIRKNQSTTSDYHKIIRQTDYE